MKALRSHGAKLAALVLVLVLAVVPFYETPYNNNQITLIFIFAMAILGLNLLAGYTGQLSVAQSLLLGIGGYTAAILVTEIEMPHLLTIPAAGFVAMFFGWLIAMPVLRLQGFYLMVVTLALVFVLSPVVKEFPSVTGGPEGLLIDAPEGVGTLATDQYVYLVALAVGVLLFALAARLVNSAHGPAMKAVRDNEVVAEAIGIKTTRTKTGAFLFASAFAGVAGSLYVQVIGYVSPDSFGIGLGLALFAGAFIGGIGTIAGALIGATFVQVVPLLAGRTDASLTGVIYGTAVIVSIMAFPEGLAGLGATVNKRLRKRSTAKSPTVSPDPPTAPAATPTTSISSSRNETR
jgi:branched-chain amino acid transport system permease protein